MWTSVSPCAKDSIEPIRKVPYTLLIVGRVLPSSTSQLNLSRF
jgi:hypothetical protein